MRLTRLNSINQVAFLMCDIQEKLIPLIKNSSQIIKVAQKVIKASEILNIPLIVTEQYPKGLGKTSPELQSSHLKNSQVFEKTQFSMLTPLVNASLANRSCLVIFGIESHVCIYQTVKDCLEHGHHVFLAADGISSRSLEDRDIALNQLRQFGAIVSTSESILFELLKDSTHPSFKAISALIKED